MDRNLGILVAWLTADRVVIVQCHYMIRHRNTSCTEQAQKCVYVRSAAYRSIKLEEVKDEVRVQSSQEAVCGVIILIKHAMDYGLSSNVANRQDFKNFVSNRSEKPDIVCVQEWWLKASPNFVLYGYVAIRVQGAGASLL